MILFAAQWRQGETGGRTRLPVSSRRVEQQSGARGLLSGQVKVSRHCPSLRSTMYLILARVYLDVEVHLLFIVIQEAWYKTLFIWTTLQRDAQKHQRTATTYTPLLESAK